MIALYALISFLERLRFFNIDNSFGISSESSSLEIILKHHELDLILCMDEVLY